MTGRPDVLVVGGGIVGLCAALAAADRQLRVVIADDGRAGAASRASAGMLGPSLDGLPAAVQALAFVARDLYPDFIARLAERSGVRVDLDRSGILEIATSEAELDAQRLRAGPRARVLQQRELALLEPALAMHAGAVHHPHDGWVDNRALMDALLIAVHRHPHIEVVHTRVASVQVGDTANATFADGGRLESSRLLLATGAWGGVTGLPSAVPVRPVKGELLTLDRLAVRHVVYGSAGYAVPRGDTLLLGATSEEVGFEPGATARGLMLLREVASALVPDLRHATVVDHWGGLRPCSPDGLPILGEDSQCPALVYASGFSRNGILLAPWAGEALADLFSGTVASRIPCEFLCGRFGGKQ